MVELSKVFNVEEQLVKGEYTLNMKDIPESISIPTARTRHKPTPTYKKVYLTANLFYSNDIHWTEQQDIVKRCKLYLSTKLIDLPTFTRPIYLHIVYSTHKDGFDIGNKCFFWSKIIEDYIVKNTNCLKDDSVKHIVRHVYDYKPGFLNLKLTLKEI